MMKKITAKMLKDKGACAEQVTLFQKTWPNGVVPSLKALRLANKKGLSLLWFAKHFLSVPANKAYNEAITPAWKAYNEAITPAWKAYNEATAPARKAYDEAIVQALWNELEKASRKQRG